MVTMNLSRAAKKFRAEMPPEPKKPKPVEEKLKKQAHTPAPPLPVPEPVAEVAAPVEVAPPVEPLPEPVALAEAPEPTPLPLPKKVWRVKAKRPRFVFVREMAERRAAPTPALPPRSTKLAARLLTQNLSLPPKEDVLTLPR